jgi:hypothetical protein
MSRQPSMTNTAGGAGSVPEKLANLLLGWSADGKCRSGLCNPKKPTAPTVCSLKLAPPGGWILYHSDGVVKTFST